jgi:hypothetical protein
MKYILVWSALHVGPFDSAVEAHEFAIRKELTNCEIVPLFTPNW